MSAYVLLGRGQVFGLKLVRQAVGMSSVLRPTVRPLAVRAPLRRVAVASPVSTQALPIEIAQVAGEASFIAGTAFTMVGITLIGLAMGFVLLRVEALANEAE